MTKHTHLLLVCLLRVISTSLFVAINVPFRFVLVCFRTVFFCFLYFCSRYLLPQDIPFCILIPHPPLAILLKRAITSISIRCAKVIYLHRLQTNIARIRAEAPVGYLRILQGLCARSCVCVVPLDLLTFLPTQALSKSRPKWFHPITLPQPSSSYSPLPFSLPHSNIISFAIHSYGHTICHHSYLPLPILHHPIFLLQHLQCIPLPFHLSRASPSYATEFAFTPLGMAHLEGVVHKCNNLS